MEVRPALRATEIQSWQTDRPVPAMLQADLREHFDRLDHDQADALVFSSPAGTPMRHSNFYRRAWLSAVAEAGPTSPEVGSNCTDGA